MRLFGMFWLGTSFTQFLFFSVFEDIPEFLPQFLLLFFRIYKFQLLLNNQFCFQAHPKQISVTHVQATKKTRGFVRKTRKIVCKQTPATLHKPFLHSLFLNHKKNINQPSSCPEKSTPNLSALSSLRCFQICS